MKKMRSCRDLLPGPCTTCRTDRRVSLITPGYSLDEKEKDRQLMFGVALQVSLANSTV